MPQHKRFTHSIVAILAIGIIVIGGCAGASFSLGPVNFDSVPRTGTLLYADPGVTITRDSRGFIRYEPGMEVLSGDSIQTADGQAVLDYEDGSTVMLKRATRVQLGSITLFFGELFAHVKSIATRGGGQVITNELSASVEGTEYGVRRDLPAADAALGHVQVYVREGHVRCAPGARANWSPLTITVNQAFEVAGYRAAPAARAVDAPALSHWADDAERRLKQKREAKINTGITVPTAAPSPRTPSEQPYGKQQPRRTEE